MGGCLGVQVVLKIIKHCRESLPTFVAGSMLGLAMDSTLEVTNCFPFPSDTGDDDDTGLSGSDYVMEMLKSMRDVRPLAAGWVATCGV